MRLSVQKYLRLKYFLLFAIGATGAASQCHTGADSDVRVRPKTLDRAMTTPLFCFPRRPALARSFLALGAALSFSAAAWAQPDKPGVRRGQARGRAADPQERERRRGEREKRAEGLRRVMASMGMAERGVQDEVLRYIVEQSRARVLVRRKAAEIYTALRDPAKTDDQIRVLLSAYGSVLAADRARRSAAEDALNERIGFRNKPRVEAALTILGVIGDAPGAPAPGRFNRAR